MVGKLIKKESEEQWQAYEYYWGLGRDKSYAKVAMQFKKAVTTVENWGKIYQWQDRIKEREKRVQVVEQEKQSVEKEMDSRQLNKRIRQKIKYTGYKQLTDGRMQVTPKLLLEVMEIEDRELRGYDKKIKIDHRHELAQKTREQLNEEFKIKMDRCKKMETLKPFDQEEDTIEAEYNIIGNKNNGENNG